MPLLIGVYLAPESPWNSIRRGNAEEAARSLKSLRRDAPERELEVARTVAYIKYTTELEKAETANASWLECFKGVNLRRTEIVSLACFPLRTLNTNKR
jgi:SP family general alpha glucoside:H+ symporter-like MFS transporter